jgi:alcohol dehydrogenase class IV
MITNPPSFPPVLLEDGALQYFEDLLQQLGAKTLFIVADKPAYEFSGAGAVLEPVFSKRETTWFTEFALNPKIKDVKRGMVSFRETRPDAVIALGGGSSIDMAKLIAACGSQEGDPTEYATGKRKLENPGPPKIVIPTTSGTGSEATHFAVVYIGEEKYSLAHPSLLFEYVIIDPTLTHSLPPGATAASGLDALCQAIESIWAVGSTDESIGYAVEALDLALAHLETAVVAPDPAARLGMAKAAHLAGKAINISKTTAPHAFSYSVTTHYGVPHGTAVALTLGAFLQHNLGVDEASCNDPRGVEAVKKRLRIVIDHLGQGSPVAAQSRLRELVTAVGCPVSLADVGIKCEHLPRLIAAVNVERLSNNPRKITAKQMFTVLEPSTRETRRRAVRKDVGVL